MVLGGKFIDHGKIESVDFERPDIGGKFESHNTRRFEDSAMRWEAAVKIDKDRRIEAHFRPRLSKPAFNPRLR